MSGIKTGNKGFVIDGKVYTVDPVVKDTDGFNIPENVKQYDPGDIKIDNTVKDIGRKTRITLGTYLSDVTKGKVGSTGVSNQYTVDPATEESQTSPIVDEKGYPRTITPSQNSEQFAKNLQPSTSEDFSELQQGGAKFKKGLSSLNVPDGNSLLPNAAIKADVDSIYVKNAKDLNEPIKTYTTLATQPNEFSSTAQFVESSIDPLSPPASFQPVINDIDAAEPKGVYAEANKTPLTLQELQQKASNVTEANEYSISPPPGGVFGDLLSPLTDPNTNTPVPLGGFINADSYVNRDEIKPLSNDASLVGTGFSKGKNPESTYNGNNLLGTVNGNNNVVNNNTAKHGSGANYSLNGAIGNDSIDEFGTPVNNNAIVPLDHPIQDYKSNGTGVLAFGNNRWAARASVTGKFNPTLKVIGSDGKVQEVSHMQMAKVGVGLTQRAAAEIPAFTADKFNPIGNLAEAGALLPSAAQLGVLKVDNQLLQAKDVLESLNGPEFDVDALTSIAPFDGQSWGSLNTAAEPFDDPSNVGLTITMLLMIVAIGGLFTLFGEINTGVSPVKKSNKGELVKGKYKFEASKNPFNEFFNINEIIGIYRTDNPFNVAAAAGAKAYFLGAEQANVSFEQLSLGALGIGLDSIVGDNSAVGANVVTCRTIIRSGLILAQQLETVSNRFKNSGISGAKASMGVFKALRSSKLIGAFNVFASLGDNLLNLSRGPMILGPDGELVPISNRGFESVDPALLIREQDNSLTPAGRRQTVTKSRLSYGQNYDPTLAWGAARSPSLYLINSSIERLEGFENLGSFKGRKGLNPQTKGGNQQPVYHGYGENASNRISNDQREAIERVLDAEYVPFSFHDVRTNEIVSFHAFLASLSDDYSVNYESSEGFGRVEPVKTYKNTTRKIGISFYVAATSEEDFDHMWYKINKLTTLIYPQFTAGRDMLSGPYQFKAPFSQLPGASPLIRIRLGDLLRSNYSRFALARLFGAADGNMKIPSAPQPLDDPAAYEAGEQTSQSDNVVNINTSQQEIDRRASIRREEINSSFSKKAYEEFVGSTLGTNNKLRVLDRLKSLPESKLEALAESNMDVLVEYVSKPQELKITIDSVADDKRFYILNIKLLDNVPSLSDALSGENTDISALKKIAISEDPEGLSLTFFASELDYTENVLSETGTSIGSKADKIINDILVKEGLSSQNLSKEIAALNNFMSPGKNAIVKSFESTAGRGLAGFIESMNFDWYDRINWDVDLGRTAPKMCKVTISFAPIHDITPGLDHLGYNRAPIYPVGAAMYKKPSQ